MRSAQPTTERYAHDEQFTREVMGSRTVETGAPFLVPYLHAGMRILDCGCGQGSITVELAELVAPGKVIGIDLRESDLVAARERASQRNVRNVKFVEANIYQVPYPDGTFAAVVAHQVLHHMSDPLTALQEIARVLQPGGVISIGDHMWDRVIRTPVVRGVDAWDALRLQIIRQNGGTPEFARNQGRLLRAAGFSRVECYLTVAGTDGTRTVTRSGQATDPDRGAGETGVPPYFRAVGRPVATDHNLATAEELDAMELALREWGSNPDAMWVLPIGWGIGWRD